MARDYVSIYEALTQSPGHRLEALSCMKPVRRRPGCLLHRRRHASQDPETRALKHGETFAVFDAFGDITAGRRAAGALSRRHAPPLALPAAAGRHRPFLLSSSLGASSHVLTVDLTNPDIRVDDHVAWPRGLLHLRRTTFLWDATCFMHADGHEPRAGADRVPGSSSRSTPTSATSSKCAARIRPHRGQRAAGARQTPDGIVFGYQGLDGVTRHTTHADRSAARPSETTARCRLDVAVAAW